MTEANDFVLHKQLRMDSLRVGKLGLCELRLVNDSRFTWCMLVPRIAGLVELHDLPTAHRPSLFDEIERVSEHLLTNTTSDKINVAAFGNLVPQLHVHVIGRHSADPAWPNPVWTAGPGETYTKADAEALIVGLRNSLGLT